jgi:hypothetical protein
LEEVWEKCACKIRKPPTIQSHQSLRCNYHPRTTRWTPPMWHFQINNKIHPTTNPTDFHPLTGVAARQDDTTVGTIVSISSRTNHTSNQNLYNSRFQEIVAQIMSHQKEFHAIHIRFDTINDQLLQNMTIASDHSKQFVHLETKCRKWLTQKNITQSVWRLKWRHAHATLLVK